MNFTDLQERLRDLISTRIAAGEFTGVTLATRAGFKQAHISNFLNRKRGLSLEGMDRMLEVLSISPLDLVDPGEINRYASIPQPPERDYENVPLVSSRIASTHAIIRNENVEEMLKFKRTFLKRLRPDMANRRDDWTRFVLIRADQENGMAMYPRMLPGATLLIDRHYNSLRPYRRSDRTMYAVKNDGVCVIRYVEQHGEQLSLRPQNDDYPIALVTLAPGKAFADYIIGRVCHVAIET